MMDETQPAGVTSGFRGIPLLVGVVGHRDLVPGEVPAIRAAIERLLRELRDTQPHVRVKLLTSQADGADLLAADVAHRLGIEIVALLPFPEAQCRAELGSDAAREVFDRTMAGAQKLEVACAVEAAGGGAEQLQEARDRQFERAGELIARYSSLVIAVWDGQDTEHRAGTARCIERRRGRLGPSEGDPQSAAPSSLLFATDNDLIYEIRCSRLTNPAPGAAAAVQVLGFLTGQSAPRRIEQGIPPGLATLLAKTAAFNRDVAGYGERIASHGRPLAAGMAGPVPEAMQFIDRLFVPADWLAVHFRRCFTRALVARFSLWALMAYLLVAFKHSPDGVHGFLTIAAVLVVFGLGWLLALWAGRRAWDRRYLDYRALAEGLRVDFYWELSGVRAHFDDAFAHETFLQKQDTQIEWIRAAMRNVTLRCALCASVAPPNGLEEALAAWVGRADPAAGSGQLAYYGRSAARLERRVANAERIAHAMLFGGLLLALVLAANVALPMLERAPFIATGSRDLLLLALFLLTAYTGIFEVYLSEKEDRSLIRQYRHMQSLFDFAARELGSARSRAGKLDILRSLGHACLTEHAQWILSHRDKRIDGMRW